MVRSKRPNPRPAPTWSHKLAFKAAQNAPNHVKGITLTRVLQNEMEHAKCIIYISTFSIRLIVIYNIYNTWVESIGEEILVSFEILVVQEEE